MDSTVIITQPSDRLGRWIGVAGLACSVLFIWMVMHRYAGITHDATLYSFQAIARLKPELLGSDLYLRYGSQDDFTIFSPIYVQLITWLGWEHAAILFTLAAHLGFMAAAWVLARKLMSSSSAWLGVGLVVALPGVYGARGLWNYFEGFITPRLPSEALVLLALAAVVSRRYWLAGAAFVVAGLVHPLMTASGIAVAICMWGIETLPRELVNRLLKIGAGAFAIVLAGALLFPAVRAGDDWLTFVYERQTFLWVSKWSFTDWARAAVYLTTLTVGSIVLPRESRTRAICFATAIVAAGGLLISYIGADLLNLGFVLQLQFWRSLWLGAVLAALLAPAIGMACMQRGVYGKLTVMLVIASWLAIDEPYSIIVAPIAIATAVASMANLPSMRMDRAMLAGGITLLIIVLIRSLMNGHLSAIAAPEYSNMPTVIRHIRAHSEDGLLPFLFLVSCWWLLSHARQSAIRVGVAAICTLACLALVPASANEWHHHDYPESDYIAFEPWRRLIPPGTEVFWIDGSVTTWALLERPRYLTNAQMASMLFSPGARPVLRKRALELAPFAEHEPFIFWSRDRALIRPGYTATLARLCDAIDSEYIVSTKDLEAEPIAVEPPGISPRYRGLKLYRCAH